MKWFDDFFEGEGPPGRPSASRRSAWSRSAAFSSALPSMLPVLPLRPGGQEALARAQEARPSNDGRAATALAPLRPRRLHLQLRR